MPDYSKFDSRVNSTKGIKNKALKKKILLNAADIYKKV